MPDIRMATPADADLIARMHAASWIDAYKNILPKDYLEDNLEADRMNYWNRKMNELTGNDFVLIAAENKKPAGFISVWETHHGDYDALVDNLHVMPAEKGKGFGRKLLLSAMEKLLALNKQSFYLWVFDQNVNAMQFYKKMGGLPKDKSFYEVRGIKIPETRMVWRDLMQPVRQSSGNE